MRSKITIIILLTLVLVARFVAVLSPRLASVSASERSGQLHVLKKCSNYTGLAGSYCTITSSNVSEIQVGSRVFYTQAAVDPAASQGAHISLDSNVVLYVGTGDWATGRCTLDTTGHGICTFSDGTGPLKGFHARVDVSPLGGADYGWDGAYSFGTESDR